jgi:8-oxo-dGTP pyrophosphatase MutT (NUDIX family)
MLDKPLALPTNESLTWHSPAELWEMTRLEQDRLDYRPTVVMTCVLVDAPDLPGIQVASVIPVHGKTWGIPQGGIEPTDRSINAATKRELIEELGFAARHLLYQKPVGSALRVSKPTPECRGDYTRGAVYIPTLVIAAQDAKLTTNPNELKAAAWRSLQEMSQDIVDQHQREPSSRTIRTIISLTQSIDHLEKFMAEQPKTRQTKQDLSLADKVLRSAKMI